MNKIDSPIGPPYWCEACQDHFDVYHYQPDPVTGSAHRIGPEFGPTGENRVRRLFVDLVLGERAVLWLTTDPRTFEVRRDGLHVGYVRVTENEDGLGDVAWH